MRHRISTIIGKGVQYIARLRGGGSALPGLVVEKIDPHYVTRALSSLPHGTIVVSGTNGKTTTTKMVVALLESQGLKVFTNRTGSNFIRGVTAALLGEVGASGKLQADVAVVELDEAHAVHFVTKVRPKYSLFLNVMRDQLDRFGEIDHTANLLRKVAEATIETVVINRDDPRLSSTRFRESLKARIVTYGVAPELQILFPSDDTMRGTHEKHKPSSFKSSDVELVHVDGQEITLNFSAASHELTMSLRGIYNMQNAAGAVALTRAVMGNSLAEKSMLVALSEVEPAFGRGERVEINGTTCELVLVKNPSGFRLSLASFDATDYDTMVAINDDYADGRDMSWLWDVDFDSLPNVSVVSGVRAYDMALRLQYDEIETGTVVQDLPTALKHFVKSNTDRPKRIFCTYTAMLTLRRELSKITKVETIQ